MLSVDIRKKMGDFRLEVQFEAENDSLALLGASGCGKSVTLKCAAGILTPDEGRIVLDGVTLYDSAAKINLPPQKRRVGYLFQNYALFPHMTVRQNIAAAIADRKRRREETEALLRRFRLEEVSDLRPGQLSGGQQQRTALARILASKPRAILLDEPFSALDSFLKAQLEAELAEFLEGFPGTVLWVSHDRNEVFRNCSRVCVLDRGRSQGTVTVEELFRTPKTEAAARLSGCENCVDAAVENGRVFLPAWGVRLAPEGEMPEKLCRVGIRASRVRPAAEGTAGAFPCAVSRVIRDLSSVTVLLLPEGAAPGAPPLRMEVSREAWERTADKRRIWTVIRPEDLLFFRQPEELDVEQQNVNG